MQKTQLKNLGKLRFKRTLCFSEMKTKDQVVIVSNIHIFFFYKIQILFYLNRNKINTLKRGTRENKRETNVQYEKTVLEL